MKTLEFRTVETEITKTKIIEVRVGGELWALWPIKETTKAIAECRVSLPRDLNEALNQNPPKDK